MNKRILYILTIIFAFAFVIFINDEVKAYGSIFKTYVYMDGDNPIPTKSGEEFYFTVSGEGYARTINYYIRKDKLLEDIKNLDENELLEEVADMQDEYGEDSDQAKKTDDLLALIRHAKSSDQVNTIIGSLPNVNATDTTDENGNIISSEVDGVEHNSDKQINPNDSDEVKKGYTASEIKKYILGDNGNGYGLTGVSDEVKEKWIETLKANPSIGNPILRDYFPEEYEGKTGTLYKQPTVTTSSTDSDLDDVISDGDTFLKSGKNNKIDTDKLSNLSGNLYNILLTIGVAVAVIVGVILGVRFIMASVEEKAVVKEGLISYGAGCVIVFGAFAIWKIAVTVLQSI